MSVRTASLSRCVESGGVEGAVLSAISSSHRLRAYSSFPATASSCRESWWTVLLDRSGRKCRGIRWMAGSSTARYARKDWKPSSCASGSERTASSASSAARRAFKVAERGYPALRCGVSPVVGMRRLSRRKPPHENALLAIPAATLPLHDDDTTVAQRHVGRLPEGGGGVVPSIGREREAVFLLGARPREQAWLFARFLVGRVAAILFALHSGSSFTVSVGVLFLPRTNGHHVHTCHLS